MFLHKILIMIIIAFGHLSLISVYGETEKISSKIEYNACYTVKNGDNLWELSSRFKDSVWLWPENINNNKGIKNQKYIYPGQKIHVSLKNNLQYRPYVMPSHLYNDEKKDNTRDYRKNSDKNVSKTPIFKYFPIDQLGFITKDTVSYVGKIHCGEYKQVLMGWNHNLFIKPYRNHAFNIGDQYLILRPERSINYKNRTIGINYIPMGLVEIKGLKPQFVKAKIIESFRPARDNDLIVFYKKKNPVIQIRSDMPYLRSRIVATDREQCMVSEGDIVYINKGQSDGVKIGHMFSIYKKSQKEMHKSRRTEHKDPVNAYSCGNILILSTNRYTSTGIINRSLEEIVLSDELIVQ